MTEKNLENVSHEEAVSALKCTSDRVVLVVAKTDAPLAPMLGVQQQQQTPLLSQSAVNLTTHHSHQPPSPNPALGNTPLLRDWNTDRDRFFRFSHFAAPLDVSGAYDPIEIPGALQVSTPRAVSEEDIARYFLNTKRVIANWGQAVSVEKRVRAPWPITWCGTFFGGRSLCV